MSQSERSQPCSRMRGCESIARDEAALEDVMNDCGWSMTTQYRTTDVDKRYSSEGATPVPWDDARTQLEAAEIFWLSTVSPDGRPHVTPLIAVWLDNVLEFCAGEDERRSRNHAGNDQCILTTGCNLYGEGLDIIVQGRAGRINPSRKAGSGSTAMTCAASRWKRSMWKPVPAPTFITTASPHGRIRRIAALTAPSGAAARFSISFRSGSPEMLEARRYCGF